MYSIEAYNLTKCYGNKKAVDSLNLKIKKGELFALLGTNGAGKTTAVKMLSSLIKPDFGEVYIHSLLMQENLNSLRQVINISPQESAIAPNLTVAENLEFMAGIYGVKNKKEKVEELSNQFGLNEVLKQKAKSLSGGWKRKLSIAISLVNEPEVLFLDEPTAALDVIARRDLWKIIEQLKGRTTIVLTTHYMEEAQALSDRIAIMSKGSLKCVGTADELIALSGKDNFEDAFVELAV